MAPKRPKTEVSTILAELLRRHNGASRVGGGDFLPLGHRLIGTGEITEMHWVLVDAGWHEPGSPWEQDDLHGHPHQWVPFALPIDGGVAFVDHRPGPTYGHVYELGIGSGDIDATLWAPSLAELFDRLAEAVERAAPSFITFPGLRSPRQTVPRLPGTYYQVLIQRSWSLLLPSKHRETAVPHAVPGPVPRRTTATTSRSPRLSRSPWGDFLHRRGKNANLASMNDVPYPVWLNALMWECIGELQH